MSVIWISLSYLWYLMVAVPARSPQNSTPHLSSFLASGHIRVLEVQWCLSWHPRLIFSVQKLGPRWFKGPIWWIWWYQEQPNPPTPLWRWRRAYWGANSYTKCLITFVNIAVAISALAAGGGQKRFRTETSYWWCLRVFSMIFGCLSLRRYWNGILGHFGRLPAREKRWKTDRNQKHCK